MASTFTIPATALAVGGTALGPAAVPDGDSVVTLIIDRTASKGATQGFNSQPGTTTATVQIDQSNDGGATWQPLAGMGPIVGGIFTWRGGTKTQEKLSTEFNPGTGRDARAVVTVAGASVAVAGTLTTA
jgi:pyruvate-formate lyase